MGFRVLKFGGSSVADATAMSRVLDIVGGELAKGRVVLVSSAISGCTDGLLACAAGKTEGEATLMERHLAIVKRLFTGDEKAAMSAEVVRLFAAMEAAPTEEKVTFGELLSTRILARKLSAEGLKVHWADSRALVVKDDLPETYRRIRADIGATDAAVIVAPGFICGDADGRVTTLGRGGSDYSAALYAAAVEADSLQIWTDVPGLMTADPRRVPAARTVPGMSYRSALEMAEHGAKVLYAPTIAPAMEAGIDIEIRNTFAPAGRSTRISAQPDASPWVGIASSKGDLCLVGTPEACFDTALREIGDALRTAGIVPLEVRVDGQNVLVRVREAVEQAALRVLHRVFFETRPLREVNLFIAGNGAVGKALVDMVGRTAATVAERTGKTLRVAGLADSKRFRIDPAGVSTLDGAGVGDFVDAVIDLAPRGSVFVDCTDSETLYRRYPDLFRAGLPIVSSNRRSFAVPYVEYAALQAAARENGCFFRYETTVGAALPMLESLAIGANSCDEIQSLEAVVSCTLNQILSAYGEGPTFASLVKAAQEAGLTEPDPRLDLGGRDALRKLLILAREAGVQLEEKDVDIEPLIPASLFDVPLDAFYRGLEELEPMFAQAQRDALAKGCRRRFVAFLEKIPAEETVISTKAAPPSVISTKAGPPSVISTKAERPRGEISPLGYRAGIRVEEVRATHPAYHLRGTENAILIRSAFHPTPIVIQGPGEGARQAAASLLNDILR